ncbi:Tryptophan synthase subunit alpha TrpA [Helicobacter sp. NHP19-012]|uniref:Tryptophan synthase alpha chain n=1 Tax=Helicobacter gastrofelis TaxID=2849642 RepID=A0ABM7SFF3_9HELI|nr:MULTISPECIES: tryptophan synthase subunit alpha [unclassified Helicobacter]BCZ19093.1 Tryptophan synthase subunit alpha TrpA [Helicobacter sp. NHP19-012]GMB96930.1 Tryptophan synthase subunit alpha TrpA [Helicobacter sp. NHP22-001]
MDYLSVFQKNGVFVPFVVLGDPSHEESLNIVKTLIDAGADALELGFAFSDPMADGVAIQASHLRALKAGACMQKNFELLAQIHAYSPQTPIGLLLYANLIHRYGIESFYPKCADCGVASVLVADLPLVESAPFVTSARAHNIAPIFIAAPHTSHKDLEQIANLTNAYVYVLARAGVTGASESLGTNAKGVISQLKSVKNVPCLLGFGISKPAHAKEAQDMGANGVICGSAVVKILEQNLNNPPQMHAKLKDFVQGFKA